MLRFIQGNAWFCLFFPYSDGYSLIRMIALVFPPFDVRAAISGFAFLHLSWSHRHADCGEGHSCGIGRLPPSDVRVQVCPLVRLSWFPVHIFSTLNLKCSGSLVNMISNLLSPASEKSLLSVSDASQKRPCRLTLLRSVANQCLFGCWNQ